MLSLILLNKTIRFDPQGSCGGLYFWGFATSWEFAPQSPLLAIPTMLRITTLLCAALLISAPAFADSCSRHKEAASDTTEQKKEVQS